MPYAIAPLIIAIFVLIVLSRSVRVNQEYERAVFFRLGRLGETKGPGLFLLLPVVDRAVKVDLRTITVTLETQETITRDGVAGGSTRCCGIARSTRRWSSPPSANFRPPSSRPRRPDCAMSSARAIWIRC